MPVSTLLRLGLLLLLAAPAVCAQPQPEPVKFGQPDAKELTAAPFAADSGAAAVVLCDYGRSRLKGQGSGFQVVFERVTRLKILKKAGYDWATVEVPLYRRDGNQEKVSSLKGFTYNLVNGAVERTKLDPAAAFLEKRTASLNVQKFTLPNVREGSVIEYSYTLTSDFLFNFQDWTFQREIPVRWSEYRTSIPVFYKYKIIYQGGRPFAVDEVREGSTTLRVDEKVPSGAGPTAGQVVGSLSISAPTEEHRWVLRDLPAFRREPYLTATQDYVPRLDFQLVGEQWPDQPYRDLSGSWEKINERLLGLDEFGGRLGRPAFLKDELAALAAQHPLPADRAAAVRELILRTVRYDGRDRYTAPDPARKAADAHRGTAADVNLLLIAALRGAGVEAHPVLLSTRDHGRISQEYPLVERFNYVLALVPLAAGQDLLVDATEPLLPCGTLPERCLSGTGRLIAAQGGAGRWVSLAPSQRHVQYQKVDLTLDAQGGLTGTVREEYGGYAAAAARAELASVGEKKYLADRQQRLDAWAPAGPALGQVADVAKPLTFDCALARPGSGGAGPFYLSPLAAFGERQNPFRREAREYPVDFGTAQEQTLLLTLTLPPGYELAALPKAVALDLPDGGGRYLYQAATPTPGTVQLTSRLTLRQTSYPAGHYVGLRELYRVMLEKQAEKLVIQKIAGG